MNFQEKVIFLGFFLLQPMLTIMKDFLNAKGTIINCYGLILEEDKVVKILLISTLKEFITIIFDKLIVKIYLNVLICNNKLLF